MEKTKTTREIEALLDEAVDRSYAPSHYPDMTYEEGVRNTLDRVLGNAECSPLED